MNPKIMTYRPGPNHPARSAENMEKIGNLDGFLTNWQTPFIVSESNSAITNGEYDLITTYRGDSEDSMFGPGVWEVIVFDLPE